MSFNVYWWMLDIDNYQLITSPYVIPGDIKDSKEIVLTEAPIPGTNYKPITYGGGGNRKISFALPLIKRDQNIGNLYILKQFDMLRNQAGATAIMKYQFTPTPRVLYQWGTGSTPQIYWVKKCDATNKMGWINRAGFPMYSEIDIELWLDESTPLYYMEEVYRQASARAGVAQSALAYIIKTPGNPI
jgi:hypothetical protein